MKFENKLLSRIYKKFIPIFFEKEEHIQKSILVISCLLISILFTLFYAIFFYIIKFFPAVTMVVFIGLFLTVNLLIFKRYGNFTAAGHLYAVTVSTGFCYGIFYGGGIYSPIVPWFTVAPVGSYLLGTRRVGFFWTAASILILSSFYVLEEFHVKLEYRYDMRWHALNYAVTFIGMTLYVTVIVILYEIMEGNILRRLKGALSELNEANLSISEQNQLIRLINSLSNLNDIFIEISKYIHHQYSIQGSWLFLPDEKKEFLYAFKAYSYEKLPPEKYEYVMQRKFPLRKKEGGMLFHTFQRKRPFYLSKIPKFEFEIDREIVSILNIQSFLYVPLVRKGECVGIFCFSNMEKEMKLSKKEIQRISNLCLQIAGAVDMNHLIQQVEENKTKTEKLNFLIKRLNEHSDLAEIMEILIEYINKHFSFPYFGLQVVDKRERVLKFVHGVLPEYVSSEHLEILKKISIPIDGSKEDSIHRSAIQNNIPIYIKDANKEIKTNSGKNILKILKHRSSLTLPMFLQNQPIAALDLFSVETTNLQPEGISELSLIADHLAGIINSSLLLKQIQEEKEKVEKNKQEIEALNELTTLINSSSNISQIFKYIFSHLKRKFGFTNFWVLLADKENNELFSDVNTIFWDTQSYLDIEYFFNFRAKLEEGLGTLYQTYSKKIPLFVSDTTQKISNTKTLVNAYNGNTYSFSKTDIRIIKKGRLKSLLQIPLILQEKVIGILCIAIHSKQLNLSSDNIEELIRFSNQIAGAIYNAQLLKQTEEAKAQAEREKGIALTAQKDMEKQKRETEELNSLIKNLNEKLDLKVIFQKVHKYIKSKFGINDFGLYTVNSDQSHIQLFDMTMPAFVSTEDEEIIRNLRIPIQNMLGAHTLAFQAKKPLYQPKINKARATAEELYIIEKCKIQSFLMIPLMLNGEFIGILDLSNFSEKMKLSKQEITHLSILGEQLAGIIHGSNLFKQVQEEKEKAILAKEQALQARAQIEFLNDFNKQLNSNLSLNRVIDEIYQFALHKYKFDTLFLILKENDSLKIIRKRLPHQDEKLELEIDKFRIPISDKGGLHYSVFSRKRTYFLKDAQRFKNKIEGTDLQIMNLLNFKSALYLPLVIEDKCIGLLDFVSIKEELFLSKEEQISLELIGENVSSAVYNSILLENTERQKRETEELNLLIKSLNEDMDIHSIMKKVHHYVENNYNIHHYGLYSVNRAKDKIFPIDFSFPDYVTEEDRKTVWNTEIPIINVKGAQSLALKKRKPLYFKNVHRRNTTEEELIIIDKFKMESLLIIPLILNNEMIGNFNLSNGTKMNLSREEITRLSILGEQLAGIIHGSNLFRQVQEEKEKVLTAQEETDFINNVIKDINSVSTVTDIMSFAMYHLETSYNYKDFWLLLTDNENKMIQTMSFVSPRLDSQNLEYFKNFKKELNPEIGIFHKICSEQKTFYAPISDIPGLSPTDTEIIRNSGWNCFFFIPLVIYEEVIGILCLQKDNENNNISVREQTLIDRLGSQIAGAVQNAKLLNIAESAQIQAEKAKNEIERLNEFTKLINSTSNIAVIFKEIYSYIYEIFGFSSIWMLLADRHNNQLYADPGSSFSFSQYSIEYFISFKEKLGPSLGTLYQTYTNKVPLYIQNYKDTIPGTKGNIINKYDGSIYTTSRTDLKIIAKSNICSILQIPLLLHTEVIGIMSLSTPSKEIELSKEEIEKVFNFSKHIAGVIYNAQLLKQTEEAMAQAEIEKGIALVAQQEAEKERQKSEKLLLNILPKDVASELKEKGFAEPVLFENVSVMFTDFKGFTTIAEKLSPQELIKDLDACFVQFDKISERYNLEKLKTIGDSYMCAGGIPRRNTTHAVDSVLAAIEIQDFMNLMKKIKEEQGFPYWELRLGIHSGPLVAGVIGERKFAYDVWGDTVNTASRMESSGTPGKINISGAVYELVKEFFECEYRGRVSAKNKGEVDMYYVHGLKPEYSKNKDSRTPNAKFWEKYGGL